MLARRALLAGAAAGALLVLSGCATPPPSGTAAATPAGAQSWSGRLALKVEGSASQSFSALFDLRGSPEAGELVLTSPIGTVFGRLSWSPGQATLEDGQRTRSFASVDALVSEVTGTPVPVTALFGWLRGEAVHVEGWQADLSQQASGRLVARRSQPQPEAELRIAFDAR